MGIKKYSPIDKKVVLHKQSSKRSNSRKTKHFSKAWKKLTSDKSILDLVEGYVIPFQRKPFQSNTLFQLATSPEQQKLMYKEVKEIFKKSTVRQANTVKVDVLSNFFLLKKNGRGRGGGGVGGVRSVINLKHLNDFIPYSHFKMEGLQNLRYLLKEIDYMCKLNLKDTCYCLSLQKISRK